MLRRLCWIVSDRSQTALRGPKTNTAVTCNIRAPADDRAIWCSDLQVWSTRYRRRAVRADQLQIETDIGARATRLVQLHRKNVGAINQQRGTERRLHECRFISTAYGD